MKIYNIEKFSRSFVDAIHGRRKFYGLLKDTWFKEDFYTQVHGRNCENVIGFTAIPTGIVGPILVDSHKHLVPIATTEGALVASINRGCNLLSAGVTTHVKDLGMTRSPLVTFPHLNDAVIFSVWIEQNWEEIREYFEKDSSHLKLMNVTTRLIGCNVHILFRATTGDAMGMNMITIAVDNVLRELLKKFQRMTILSISGNYCSDKKVSAQNLINGRGKYVVAEAKINKDHVFNTLHCTGETLVKLNIQKNHIGGAIAGVFGGFNGHSANVIAGIFTATGQDLGHIGTSSICTTVLEDHGDFVSASVTLPNLEVGIVGGGTELIHQKDHLKMIDAKTSIDFAKVVGATVLAGELSLLGALASGEHVDAHYRLGRSKFKIDSE